MGLLLHMNCDIGFNRNIVGYKLPNIKNEGENMYGRKNNRNNDLLLLCVQA